MIAAVPWAIYDVETAYAAYLSLLLSRMCGIDQAQSGGIDDIELLDDVLEAFARAGNQLSSSLLRICREFAKYTESFEPVTSAGQDLARNDHGE